MTTFEVDSRWNPYDINSDDDTGDKDEDIRSWIYSGYWQIDGNNKWKLFFISDNIVCMTEDLYGIVLVEDEVEKKEEVEKQLLMVLQHKLY